MRLTFALVAAAGIVACHKAPQVEPRPARDLGDYAYRMTIQGVPVEGEFSIEADTVLLDAEDHSCRRAPTGIIDPLVHPFSCGGVCAAMGTEVVVENKRISGRLEVTRIASVDRP